METLKYIIIWGIAGGIGGSISVLMERSVDLQQAFVVFASAIVAISVGRVLDGTWK